MKNSLPPLFFPVWNPCCKVAINLAQRANFAGALAQNQGQIGALVHPNKQNYIHLLVQISFWRALEIPDRWKSVVNITRY